MQKPSSRPAKPLVPHIGCIRHFVVSDGAILHLDSLVESMIVGAIPRKHILLEGVVGSGKRTLARAIASEFGGKVVELEPKAVRTRGALVEILCELGANDVLITHNVDEWCPEAQFDTANAMVDRAIRQKPERAQRPNPFRAAMEDFTADDGSPIAEFDPFLVIATTNAAECVADQLREACVRFSVPRSREGMRAATERALKFHGIHSPPEATNTLVDYFMIAYGDPAETALSIVISHLRTVGAIALTPQLAVEVVEGAWSFQPIGAVIACVKSVMAERGTKDLRAIALEFHLPPSVSDQVARAIKRRGAADVEEVFEEVIEEE